MRAISSALLFVAIAACRPQPAEEAPLEPDNVVNAAAEPLPEPDINASLEPVAGSEVAPLRFVGRWAAEERLCARSAWRFTERELRTPAGSVCRFTEVRSVPGGFDIAARCTAEAPERDDVLRLRFAESAGAVLFESESIADVGLVRCGD